MGTVISLTFSLMQWLALVLFIIIGYELIRWAVVSFFKRKFLRSITQFLRKNEVRFDQFKLTNKLIIKDQLLHTREVTEQILEKSRSENLPYEEVREQAEQYIDEIVPTFNLLSYYKFGYPISQLLLKSLYEVIIDKKGKERASQVPDDALVIYVMNHRSNFDYVVLANMLLENISVSYAVGEWARVFPLDLIFKSFGAYFIRRNYRDPLYHAVLKHYVQLISDNRVTQGIFLEGALSRDGRFRTPKTGLLDYILTSRTVSNENSESIAFIPVGINYDWILEDNTLISEWKEGKRTLTLLDYFTSFITILVRSPYVLTVNILRLITGRMKEHGYVSVKFGEPIELSELLEPHSYTQIADYSDRRTYLKQIGQNLLRHISQVVPVTPVSLLSLTLIQHSSHSLSKHDCINSMRDVLTVLEQNGAELMMGEDYDIPLDLRYRLEAERWLRKRELVEFEEDLIKGDEIERTLQLAVDLLVRRKVIKLRSDSIEIVEDRRGYLEYYANTIMHYLQPDHDPVGADSPN